MKITMTSGTTASGGRVSYTIDLPEIPACAAIRSPDEHVIIAGRRHNDCLASAHNARLDTKFWDQGFMTTRGRFVGRSVAQGLAKRAGMASARDIGYLGSELYSEDLY